MIQVLKYIIYGLISGLAEIIPASSRGHQAILMLLYGMNERDPMLDFMVHAGIIACIVFSYKTELSYLFISGKNKQATTLINKYDRRLIYSALLPTVIGLFFFSIGTKYETSPVALSVFFLINGIILLVPDYIRQSDRQAAQLGGFDSILIGLSGFVSVFPGLSRVGSGCSLAILRGADKKSAFNWLLLLTVPALLALMVLDIIGLFTIGLPGITLWLLLGYVLAAAASFAGTYIAIILMKFLTHNTGTSVFSFYSFGAALFTFIVYLMAF